MTFTDKITAKWNEGKFVCVGLDSSDYSLLQKVVDDTHDLVCAYKPNSAFYEAEGASGWKILEDTVKYIQQKAPDVVIILDAKRGDIGNTNKAYAKAAFETLGVDAMTVNPYPGKEALQPFLDYKDKGIILWIGASNPGTDKIQDLPVGESKEPLYQYIAKQVIESWNINGNCAIVVGATYPQELKTVRNIVGDMPILVPGVGAQGGDLEATIKNGLNSKNQGLIISSSRGIIFAPDPRKAAQDLHQQIQKILKNV